MTAIADIKTKPTGSCRGYGDRYCDARLGEEAGGAWPAERLADHFPYTAVGPADLLVESARIPDRKRQEIQATRADLASNVDHLADRTNPARMARRGCHRLTDKMHSFTDTVIGKPAPHYAAEQTRGNPIAAGMIAFGAGSPSARNAVSEAFPGNSCRPCRSVFSASA